MVNLNVQWAGPNASLSTLAATLNARFGYPTRTYEYVAGSNATTWNITSHNADNNGRGHAMDIFVGAGHNISVEQGIDLAERLRLEGTQGIVPGHPDRLAYIIHRGRIAGDHTGWQWQPYNGIADHYDHIHVSSVFDYYWGDKVAGNPADYNSTAPWGLWDAPTNTTKGFLMALNDKQQADIWWILCSKEGREYLIETIAARAATKVLNTPIKRQGADVSGNTTVAVEASWGTANTAWLAKTGGASTTEVQKAVKDALADGIVKVDVKVAGVSK